jgi:hypothetical protein
MTYYKDLTRYEYFVEHEPLEPKPLNVGWLSDAHPFDIGETSQEFKERLFTFCLDKFVVQIARGFHVCELCAPQSAERWYKESESRYGKQAYWCSIGNGEIRVIDKAVVYAAPTLIYHYIVEHQYRPPDEFIDAVLSGPQPDTEEHKSLLGRYS